MAQVKDTMVTLVSNPNGSVSIYKGHRYDMVAQNMKEARRRVSVLRKLGYKVKVNQLKG